MVQDNQNWDRFDGSGYITKTEIDSTVVGIRIQQDLVVPVGLKLSFSVSKNEDYIRNPSKRGYFHCQKTDRVGECQAATVWLTHTTHYWLTQDCADKRNQNGEQEAMTGACSFFSLKGPYDSEASLTCQLRNPRGFLSGQGAVSLGYIH